MDVNEKCLIEDNIRTSYENIELLFDAVVGVATMGHLSRTNDLRSKLDDEIRELGEIVYSLMFKYFEIQNTVEDNEKLKDENKALLAQISIRKTREENLVAELEMMRPASKTAVKVTNARPCSCGCDEVD